MTDDQIIVKVFRDGSRWFAVDLENFTNLQESTFGVGASPLNAIRHLFFVLYREELAKSADPTSDLRP